MKKSRKKKHEPKGGNRTPKLSYPAPHKKVPPFQEKKKENTDTFMRGKGQGGYGIANAV